MTSAPTATFTITEETRVRTGLSRLLLSRDGLFVAVLLLLVLVACLFVPRFASPVTTGYLLLNAMPALLIALPMTLIIITGEIDLSVASIVAMSTVTVGTLTTAGWPFGAAAAAAIVVGLIAGAVNGVLIAFVGLPSLAVTIGTLALFRGLALVVIGDRSVSASSYPDAAIELVGAKLGGTGIPVLAIAVAAAVAIFAIVLHATPFGRGLFAVGYSKEAARFVGIRVPRVKFVLYVLSGLMCGVVGVFWALSYSARSDSASGLELTVIAAVLLGGVSIFGGRGSILGAVTGVLVIAVVTYAMRLQRIPDVTLVIVTGALLIVSVVGPSIFAAVRRSLHVRRVQRTLPRPARAGAENAPHRRLT
ncbi:ABC transporter permease [Microbacterium sp. T32]|uniref:ABC transporter permease n=1 Tax=Microbacterium sp. T32 TaxID=1776083 RepID=UPI0007AB733E|nr:ABC transporter permease [Microbacterium sp. T32]KZE39530.1 ATPase [Microbacterium sp. T32]